MTSESFFKRIETHYGHQLPFVIYRKPRETNVQALLQQTNDLYLVNDFTENGFVFAPFDDAESSVLMPIDHSESLVVSAVSFNDVVTAPINTGFSVEEKAQHILLVKKGISAINEKYFEKVVLSRKETVPLTDASPLSIFKNLLKNYPLAFVYCWYHPKVGLWLGATPETLIKIHGDQLSIMALAGTQVYKGSLDVIWEEKEQDEQKYVTDFIVDTLKPLVESLHVSGTETVMAGALLHLKTMVSARLKATATLKKLISRIHPTPAVCGLPKDPAKQFILEHENYNRAFYTGFLGELNFETTKLPRTGKRNIENRAYAITQKSTQLYVNLRCMQLKETQAIIYVGGGITAHSKAEAEWEETVSKSLTIKNIL